MDKNLIIICLVLFLSTFFVYGATFSIGNPSTELHTKGNFTASCNSSDFSNNLTLTNITLWISNSTGGDFKYERSNLTADYTISTLNITNSTDFQINSSYFNFTDGGNYIYGCGFEFYNLSSRNSTGTLDMATNKTFIIDWSSPTSAVVSDLRSLKSGETIKFTCTSTDLYSSIDYYIFSVKPPLLGNFEEYVKASNTFDFTYTENVGDYSFRCKSQDIVGNEGAYSTESTFAVTRANAGSNNFGSSTGGSSVRNTVTALTSQKKSLGDITLSEGTIKAYINSVINFVIYNENHKINFDEVSYIEGTATITISSDPITLTLSIGDVKAIDLEGDGIEDIQVTLNSIDVNGMADMTIKHLEDIETTEAVEQEVPISNKHSSIIWWIMIIVVVMVIIVLLIPKKKR